MNDALRSNVDETPSGHLSIPWIGGENGKKKQNDLLIFPWVWFLLSSFD